MESQIILCLTLNGNFRSAVRTQGGNFTEGGDVPLGISQRLYIEETSISAARRNERGTRLLDRSFRDKCQTRAAGEQARASEFVARLSLDLIYRYT